MPFSGLLGAGGDIFSKAFSTRCCPKSILPHQHFHDLLAVRLAEAQVIFIGVLEMEEHLLDLLVLGQFLVQRGQGLGRRTVLLDELQGLLRSDAPDPFVEVRPDQYAQVDELLPAQADGGQGGLELRHLHLDVTVLVAPGHLPSPGQGEVAYQPRGAEKERIEVLAGGGPDIALGGHVGGLGLSLPWRLDDGDAEMHQQHPGRFHDLVGELRGLGGLGVGLLHVPLLDRLLPFLMRLGPPLAPLPDGGGLQPGGDAVEDVDRAQAQLDEVGVAVEQPGQMTGDPPFAVHERRAVGTADDGEELVDGIVGVDGHGPAFQLCGVQLGEAHQVAKVHAHVGTFVRRHGAHPR